MIMRQEKIGNKKKKTKFNRSPFHNKQKSTFGMDISRLFRNKNQFRFQLISFDLIGLVEINTAPQRA